MCGHLPHHHHFLCGHSLLPEALQLRRAASPPVAPTSWWSHVLCALYFLLGEACGHLPHRQGDGCALYHHCSHVKSPDLHFEKHGGEKCHEETVGETRNLVWSLAYMLRAILSYKDNALLPSHSFRSAEDTVVTGII